MSTASSCSRGIDVGPSSTNARTIQNATPAPAAPPSIPRTRLSVSSCATSWRRLAPRAARTATSRARAWPRASSRFATLAHAIRSTNVTEPNTVTRVGRMPPNNPLVQRHRRHRRVFFGFREFGRQAVGHRLQRDGRLAGRHRLLQARQHLHPLCAARAGREIAGLEDERLPEFRSGRKPQTGRSDSDNRHRLAIERRRRAHDVRTSAESTPPQAVGDDDLIAITLRVAFRERAAECHRHTHQVEVVPRDSRALEPLRIGEPGHVDGDGFDRRCVGKGVAWAHVVANIQWREPGRDTSVVSVIQNHQAAWITIWQRSKQHAVDDRKHRRRRADAERQGENRHTSERRLPLQHPQGMTHVPNQ